MQKTVILCVRVPLAPMGPLAVLESEATLDQGEHLETRGHLACLVTRARLAIEEQTVKRGQMDRQVTPSGPQRCGC